ncbi:kinase-like domain-containing protein [Hyaloraphidium curvatum]|nr:kinase-like domain-containing protein [Hyaloraphidium curvatum]
MAAPRCPPSPPPSPPRSPRSPPPPRPAFHRVGAWLVAPEPMGSGSFAAVRPAFHASTGAPAVCKTTTFSRSRRAARKQRLCVLREMATLAALAHPNIVRIYDAVWTDAAVHLFMERVDGVELFEYLRQDGRGGRVPEDDARVVTVQCLNALQHMHDRRVLHRDVKLDNIMVVPPLTLTNPNPFPLVKIIDFNLSAFYHPAYPAHETCGCIHYTSPWICGTAVAAAAFAQAPDRNRPHGLAPATLGVASDVWALAVSVFGALQGYFPFRALTVEALSAEIACLSASPIGSRLTYPHAVSSAARHFLETGMDPLCPTTAHNLLQHPWLAPIDALAAAYPILSRERSPVAGRHHLSSPWDSIVPPDACDDSWYPLSLLISRNRSMPQSHADALRREEERSMERCCGALSLAAERLAALRGPALPRIDAAGYPSPTEPHAVPRPAGPTDPQGGWFPACATPDSGYASACSSADFSAAGNASLPAPA